MELDSSFDVLDQVVEAVEAFLVPLDIGEEERYNIVLLTTEAVTNAIEHGNQLDPQKRVSVQLSLSGKRLLLTVEDEGPGFKLSEVKDPLAEEQLLATGGRGIYLIEALSDEVYYENGGRRVCIVFRFEA